MSIKLSDSIRVGQQKPLEDKYFNELVPYTSTSQVNTLLLKSVRHIGLTVNINNEEYWYKDGIEDSNLVFKSNQKTIEITREELYNDLIPNEKLEPGRLYKITGVESWCFSQHLIKAIYLKSITNNTLESEGVGEFYTPKYNTSDSNLGIWKGELLANGMITSASYNIGDKVIWGNLFWENISGNIGSNFKNFGEDFGDIRMENYLSELDWQLITPNDDISLYNTQFDSIKYDFQNDYINYRADDLGNIYDISYNTLLYFFPNAELPTFYHVNAIALFKWGITDTSNNVIHESVVLNCNFKTISFKNNYISKNSVIIENNFLNVDIIGNTLENSGISNNYLKTYGGILYNNLEKSSISSNKYYFKIDNNTLKNNSSISNNNDNNIIVNGRYSSITSNNLDNNSTIINNIFVEEGNDISVYKKGIYDNVLTTYCNINSNTIKNDSRIFDNTMTTYCNINNNTIKNGSRIFGHTMNYYSTINGNTLDTDSNIYNNQLIQNGKIDNNILTGHGRIYGNQLDRGSEITLCKLRIYPTTSYSSGMHGNRLFTGKIQNVDFGDIVNPVGSDPNNPAFGGNVLTGCIIENGSIIKDLTFPNHGGVGIQFVKVNGFSEFKNITVNNSIRNVDFVNTIFNETSDYSKLIEGSGHQTNGFTKTYIDGVLLQDKFNKKQDVLTEDNVGEFMDLELATKSTPTSGDTVLAMDSVTGKAVKIPTDQLGGSGSVDTSNLVPFTGANKDLNIGAHYFESSQGFKKTGGTPSQYLMADGSTSTLPTDLIKGTGTVNYLTKFTASGAIGNSQIFDNGTNVGIGILNPINKFTILGADDTLPTLGTSSGKLGIFNDVSGNPTYGMLYGVLGNGSSYIQSQRVDGVATAYDLLLQPSGGNVSIGGITTPSEKLDVDGNIKANGFKTPTGTATQALTADGGAFDLTTKADLVGGKVPQSQLPSIGKTTFTYDILVSNWTLVSGKYEAVIYNAGILANSFVDVIPSNDHVDIVRAAQIYPSVLISAGSVKVYSKFLPSGTISVTVNII